jgi:hypothetical protein
MLAPTKASPATAVFSAAVEAATSVWQVGVLRAEAWFARALRVPAPNALLADLVPASAYGFERAMRVPWSLLLARAERDGDRRPSVSIYLNART